MGREILVDGYNIIKNSASFRAIEARNLAAARAQLINQLMQRYRHTPHRVTIVFDGDGSVEQVSHQQHICIRFSRHGETADSVIARLAFEARQAGKEVEMYSDDREVQSAVSRQGGEVRSSGQLTDQLNAAPRDLVQRYKHRQAAIRDYGLDPSHKAEDDKEPPHSHGKKKKSSRR